MTVVLDERYYKSIAEMLDALPERVIRYRLSDHIISDCNKAWAAGHNLGPEDIIGRPLDELLSAAERVGLEAQLARLGPDNTLLADDVPRPAPHSPGQWVEWVDRYLPGSDGAEVLAVGRDVTGRHIAELNLADSEARFRDLADKSADVVWRFVIDPHPHFDYMSPSIENILGYPPSDFLDDLGRFDDILDDGGRALVSRALHGGRVPERYDLRFRRADGSIVVGETHTNSVLGGRAGCQPRCHRATPAAREPGGARAPRSAHRLGQPASARRAARSEPGTHTAQRHAARGGVPRPRRLENGERHLRP
jgi:PAS domain S-box-containing protein